MFDSEPVSANHASVLAAMEEAKEAMLRALSDANRLGHCSQMDEATESKGWEAFRKATGHDEPLTFGGRSMQGVVDAGIDALKGAMKEAK